MNSLDAHAVLEGIAIIGMAGRFPGARTVEEFWENLRDGKESVSFFSDQELLDSGVDPALLRDPHYVKAGSILQDVDLFDASFFGYSPREAEMLDPQQRLFLECSWQALENAGYDPESVSGPIGIYGGASLNSYFLNNLFSNREYLESAGLYQVMLGSDKDFLTTRVSYKLNLKGPSLDLQTACSTSLVAVQVACQSLLNYQCDLALAGGVSISVPQKRGYLYQEGMILSPDGHCRAFDAEARGTIAGQGVGMVLLKRVSEAVTDGDHIYAVIKGAAVNNDGASKVGYTAPGVDGQTEVIALAQSMAEVEAETISYVETHGTATPLGDPIEMTALTQAFRLSTRKRHYCAIGSVKSNIGHLDAAAGVASLIKTTKALEYRLIPPSINYNRPNPKIDFDNSPFYVNTELSDWQTDGSPRRAGVSSFGIGGTNAHVILEEAPSTAKAGPSRPWQLVCLSAKTRTALESAGKNLAKHLMAQADVGLADAAFTLQVGRRAFGQRQFAICSSVQDAVSALENSDPRRIFSASAPDEEPPVIFMFPGQGSQYVNMGLELYRSEPVFREQVDYCAEFLRPLVGFDLRETLYPSSELSEAAARNLNETRITQPALFVIEYALARLVMKWGIQPQAMIGHSIGEYAAACLSGVVSLEDALTLVAARGQLMHVLPAGAMLIVPLPVEQVRLRLPERLSIAAINAPAFCVVSGPMDAISQFESQLAKEKVDCRRLQTSHGFHSEMMESVLEPFTEQVKRVKLNPPQIPFISNVTGTWITTAEATNPTYWATHLRQTVRFSEGVGELLKQPKRILLEIGPGRTLSSLISQHPNQPASRKVLTSLRHPQEQRSDTAFLLNTLGQLWLAGSRINWSAFYEHERRHRVPLPTYPFERQRYWVEPQKNDRLAAGIKSQLSKRSDVADWFYLPSWKRYPLPAQPGSQSLPGSFCWLIFVDAFGIGSHLATRLEQNDQKVVRVSAGDRFYGNAEHHYTIRPNQLDDYVAMLKELRTANSIPDRVVHLWSVTSEESTVSRMKSLEQFQDAGFWSLIHLARALGEQNITSPIQIEIISNGIHEVIGGEFLCPENATLLGPCKVIPVEYPNIRCRSIDVDLRDAQPRIEQEFIEPLMTELTNASSDQIIAYRSSQRWIQTFEPVRLKSPAGPSLRLREDGVYLITGGLGGMGLVLAEHLATSVHARLILTGRSAFPAKESWEEWLSTHEAEDPTSAKIRKIQSMESLGAQVLVMSADVADEGQMQAVVKEALARFGQIHGVIHTAGVIDYAGVMQRRTRESTAAVMAAKLQGTLVLESVLQDVKLDFFVLCSTLGSILPNTKFGQVGYSAANEFLDAYADYRTRKDGTFTVTINWTDWSEVGMSVAAVKQWAELHKIDNAPGVFSSALSPAEGVEVFTRAVEYSFPRLVISTDDLASVKAYYDSAFTSKLLATMEKSTLSKPSHGRPELSTAYAAPENDLERNIVEIWEELLGIQRIGIHDNFFELGGHSLLATQVVSRIRHDQAVEISLQSLFEAPTPNGLATLILNKRVDQIDEKELAELLTNLEQLSAEEIKTLLDKGD